LVLLLGSTSIIGVLRSHAGECDGGGNLPTGEIFAGTTDAVLFPNSLRLADHFGEALAVGDFNGDGIDDLAVGAPDVDYPNLTNAGAVAVYYGALNFTPACPTSPCADITPVFDEPDVKIRGTIAAGRYPVPPSRVDTRPRVKPPAERSWTTT
jgi:hypothetical protein